MLRHPYHAKVTNIAKANLIMYHPLWESAGTSAADRSGVNGASTYSGLTLASQASPAGSNSPLGDGVNDYVDIVTGTNLASNADKNNGTMSIWARVSGSGVWTDGNARMVFGLSNNARNRYIRIAKSGSNNTLKFQVNTDSNDEVSVTSFSPTTWQHYLMIWDGTTFEAFINGSSQGSGTKTTDDFTIQSSGSGISGSGTSLVWDGYCAHAALWDTQLSQAEIDRLAKI